MNLLIPCQYLLHCVLRHVVYLRLISFTYKASQRAFDMINLRRRPCKRGVGIVAKGRNANIRDLLRQEIFQSESLRLRVCPGDEGIAAELTATILR
jgi:hypothetical protein